MTIPTVHCTFKAPTEERMLLQNRLWQGCPSIECTRKGRLYASWQSGGFDEPSLINFNLLVVSDDGGFTWRELFAIDSIPEIELQAMEMQPWMAPDGKLWIFWQERNFKTIAFVPGYYNLWAITCDDPDAPEPKFSEPFYVGDGFLRCKPTVLKDGRWLLPAYDWKTDNIQYLESCDNGKTFQAKYAGKRMLTECDENMILERNDGSLWMLARVLGGTLSESESFDGGKTWSDFKVYNMPNPCTRFYISRLPSGRVLFINNDDAKSRVNLQIHLSEDDGKTWKYNMLLDGRFDVSYPDVAFGPEGELYIIHDRNRPGAKEILISRLTEDDIMKGEPREPSSYQNQIICKAPAVPTLGMWYKNACEKFFREYLKDVNEKAKIKVETFKQQREQN